MKKLKAILMLLLVLGLLLSLDFNLSVRADTFTDAVKDAEGKLKEAKAKLQVLSKNSNAGFSQKVNLALNSVNSALGTLKDTAALYNNNDTNNVKLAESKLTTAENQINRAIDALQGAEALQKATKDDLIATVAALNNADKSLQSIPRQTATTTESTAASPAASQSPKEPGNGEGWLAAIGDYVAPVLQVFVVALALGLLVYSILLLMNLRSSTDDYFNAKLPKILGGMKSKQDELATQIAAYAGVNKDINQRLSDLHTELRQVSRSLQISQQGMRQVSAQPAAAAPGYAEPASRDGEMPSFPISVDDFLRRMQRKVMVVKRDFQNDMLVSDPEGKGELVLIRDARLQDEVQPLFVVPRVTQFQMRQEYHNFYEKYYDCSNPESGAVWIIDPAVVDKVAGGWQLREKGRLEVR